MSRSLKGPWIAPADDAFDGRAYYAARSCSDGKHRYLFGWAATKTDNQDMNSWDWAGTFVCHEIYQRPDGTLGVKLPDSMLSAFEPAAEVLKGDAVLKTVDSQANLRITETPEDFFKVEMDFQISDNTRKFGIRLFEDPETGDAYKYEVNLAENRIYFFGSLIGSCVVGIPLGFLLCNKIAEIPGLSYISYRFPWPFLLLYFVLVFVVHIVVTVYQRHILAKQSVVERIKAIE